MSLCTAPSPSPTRLPWLMHLRPTGPLFLPRRGRWGCRWKAADSTLCVGVVRTCWKLAQFWDSIESDWPYLIRSPLEEFTFFINLLFSLGHARVMHSVFILAFCESSWSFLLFNKIIECQETFILCSFSFNKPSYHLFSLMLTEINFYKLKIVIEL